MKKTTNYRAAFISIISWLTRIVTEFKVEYKLSKNIFWPNYCHNPFTTQLHNVLSIRTSDYQIARKLDT